MSRRAAAWVAWSVWALSLVLTMLSLLFLAWNVSHPGVPIYGYWAEETLLTILFSTIGALIISRSPTNNLVIGWLLTTLGLLLAVDHLCAQYGTHALLGEPGTLPGGEVSAWAVQWLWVVHIGVFVFLVLLFPDGRLPTRRWRPFAWLGLWSQWEPSWWRSCPRSS